MFDFGADYMRRTTPEQRQAFSRAGNMALDLARLKAEPPIYAPMMEGCQGWLVEASRDLQPVRGIAMQKHHVKNPLEAIDNL